MRRYMVVANQTLGGEHLLEKIRGCMSEGPCSFHIVVPATPPEDHATWTEGEARAVGRRRLDQAVDLFGGLGAEVTGEVGDRNPLLAIEDALREREFDEIILSTLPPGASRWLKLDLPSRVASRFDLPMTHVTADPEPATSP
jgi:hypothetical protein